MVVAVPLLYLSYEYTFWCSIFAFMDYCGFLIESIKSQRGQGEISQDARTRRNTIDHHRHRYCRHHRHNHDHHLVDIRTP